jgi:quinol monooxygenase YgiN
MIHDFAYPNDLVFYVKYHIKPGAEKEFQDRLLEVIDHMQDEDSFVSAFVHEYEENENRFSMYERWRVTSKEAFMTYQMDAKDYRQEYESRLPELSETPRKIHLLKPIAGWMSTTNQPSNDDLVFYVNFHLKPEKAEEWKKEAIEVLNKMSEESTFICTFLHQDEEDPSRFTIYERWNEPNLEAFEKSYQKAEDYHKIYKNLLPNFQQSMRTFKLLKPVDCFKKRNSRKTDKLTV